jgi:eukaryotic-like serine/threonine-protein kinase
LFLAKRLGGRVAQHPSDSANRSEAPSDGSRLDSWKEIAGYLQRDVTTVRRWEKREGLPVHRHLHDKLGSVYAYKTEIDDWWRGRRGQIDELGSDHGEGSGDGGQLSLVSSHDHPQATRAHRERLAWALAAACLAIAVIATATLVVVSPRVTTGGAELRFSISPPEQATFGTIAVSPDGRHVSFTASRADGTSQLWVRPLDSLSARLLPGTEEAAFPFWSPDSRFIGFFAREKLRKIAVSGGTVQTICDAPDGRGGAWNRDDVIIFAPDREHALLRVPASGGSGTPVSTVDRPRERGHLWPEFLPDGRHFLYLADSSQHEHHGIYLGALDTTESKRLLSAQSSVAYSSDGYLLVARDGALVAQPFDANGLELAGEPVTVAEQVVQQYGLDHKADFSASMTGVLAYRSGGSPLNHLVWVDRRGERAGMVGEPAVYAEPVLSPDETQLAVSVFDRDARPWVSDIWLLDLSGEGKSRFTFDRAAEFEPVWSPDGTQIVFSSNRQGTLDLYQKSASGSRSDEILLKSGSPKHAETWSPDGRYVVYSSVEPKTKYDLWVLPLFGDRQPRPYLQSEFSEGQGQISPDGRWIAYTSNESGRFEVYVGAFPAPAGKWQVSTNGGADPRWRRDGQELFYIATDGKLMAVGVEAGSVFEPGVPQPLFDIHVRHLWEDARNHYDVSRDGNRFLVATPVDDSGSLPVNVVVNWMSGLTK